MKSQTPTQALFQYLLRSCIDEAMRMSSSVTGTAPREVLESGITIGGQQIPAGIVVGTGFYSLNHNPADFLEPFVYNPERWISGSRPNVTPESVELAHSGFFPLSFRRRGCIGKNLAYKELTVVARTL
jgi:cytochrome P450